MRPSRCPPRPLPLGALPPHLSPRPPPLTAQDAILAAARRVANLDDADVDEAALDAELAAMRDVSPGPDDDDDPADDDAVALTRDDPASRRRRADDSSADRDPAAAVDARLAGWLAKHSGRPAFRAARALAARVSADRRALASSSSSSSASAAAAAAAAVPRDADGDAPLRARSRPASVPLDKRRAIPLADAAKPTPRPFEYEPPRVRGAKSVERETSSDANAAIAPETRRLIADARTREREADLPKGAGPAGRHEPEDAPEEASGGGFDPAASRVRDALAGILHHSGSGSRGAPGGGFDRGAFGLFAEKKKSEPGARGDAELLSALPPSERPVLAAEARGGAKVPRATRQVTLDAMLAAAVRDAFRASARLIFDSRDDENGSPLGGFNPSRAFLYSPPANADPASVRDAKRRHAAVWFAAHAKARRGAVKAATEAEARLFRDAGSSTIAYRAAASAALAKLAREAANAETTFGDVRGRSGAPSEKATCTQHSVSTRSEEDPEEKGGNGDARRVVPLAATRLSSSAASPLLAPADRAAVAAAVRCVEEVRAASRRNPGSRLLAAAGLVGAGGGFEGGALLQALRVEGQKKTRPAADGGSASPARGPSEQHTPDDDVLEASRTVRGEASKAFFAECAARRFPRRLEPTPAGARRRGPRRASVGAFHRGTRAAPGGPTPTRTGGVGASDDSVGDSSVRRAVRAFVRAYLEPLVDVGAVGADRAGEVLERAVAKVMRRRALAKDASFLDAEREKDAVKKLVRAYLDLGAAAGESRSGSKRKGGREGGRAGGSEAGEKRARPPEVDFDVDV